MSKRVRIIILSFVGVIVIAGLVVGALAFFKAPVKTVDKPAAVKLSTDPSKQEAQTTPDTSVDLGACTAITTGTIKTALGDVAKDLTGPDNRGFGHELTDDKTQSCVYHMVASEDGSNRLTVSVTQFASTDNRSNAIEGYKADTPVTDIPAIEVAYFTVTKGSATLKQDNYDLSVFKGQKLYDFTLTQPSDSDSFTDATAQTALTAIAKSVTY